MNYKNKIIVSIITLFIILIGVSSILIINHNNIKEKMLKLKITEPNIDIPIISEKTTTKIKTTKKAQYLDYIKTTTKTNVELDNSKTEVITTTKKTTITSTTSKITTTKPIINDEIIIDDKNNEITYDELFNSEFIKQNINYKDELLSISNPNRGFYIAKEIKLDENTNRFDYHSLSKTIDKCKDNDITIIHLLFDIGALSGNVNNDGIDKLFTDDQLKDIASILELLREYNFNAVIRFAYDFDGIENKEPKNFNIILNHVKQLRNLFFEYEDVITTIECGFIGVWGEMHDSIYNSDEYYIELLNTYLENTPSTLTINVRKPAHYQMLFGDITPNKNNINKNDNRYRIGIFNDGYLATIRDMGTYKDRPTFLKWMDNHGIFTFYGGEISWRKIEDEYLSDIDYVSEEMFITHTTYLNFQENGSVTHGKWLTQKYINENDEYNNTQALKYVNDHLGYRILLRDSNITKNNYTGDISGISFTLENVGFSNIIKEQNVSLILEKDNIYYETKIDMDITKLYSQENIEYNIGFYIPSNIENGKYNLYLKISDKTNKNYTIKLANENIYNNKLDANYLGTLNINNGSKNNISFREAFKNNYNNELIANTAKDKIIIDGKITTVSEWNNTKLILNNDSSKIYLTDDDNYLYVLIEDTNIEDATNYHIQLALNNILNINDKKEYTIGIQNNGLYYLKENGNLDSDKRIYNVLEMRKNNCIEFKLNKRLLNYNKIYALFITLYNDDWNKISTIIAENK